MESKLLISTPYYFSSNKESQAASKEELEIIKIKKGVEERRIKEFLI